MTAGEVMHRMTAQEIAEWSAYERVTGPLGDMRMDILMSRLMAVVANTAGAKRVFKPKDFLWEWDRKPQTWQDQLAIVKQMNQQMGGARGDTHRTSGNAGGRP